MRLRTFLTSCLTILLAAPAFAGSLRVDPVEVSISADQRAAAVTLTNMADAPITVHAYGLLWNQNDGGDDYSETSELIVSPPITTIPPKSIQLVRVGFRNASSARGAWRLVVEEVPQARSNGGIQVALRMNLPLFVQIHPGSVEDLSWSAQRALDGGWTVEAVNSSDKYVRLEAADFTARTGVEHSSSIRMGTVLPHSRRRWRLQNSPSLIDATQFQRIARTEAPDDRLAVISSRN